MVVVGKRGNRRISTSHPNVPGGKAEIWGVLFSQDIGEQCMSGKTG